MGKKIASWVLAIAVVVAVKVGWRLMGSESYDDTEYASEWIQDQDEWVSSEIQGGSAVPAHGWLRESRHGTFEADPEAMAQLIDRFESSGARVWVVGIEEFQGSQLSDSIAVELPRDDAQRSQVFAIESAHWEGDGTPDLGQDYLVVSFD